METIQNNLSDEGEVAVFMYYDDEGNEIPHIAPIILETRTEILIQESNFGADVVSSRTVSKRDPAFRGFWPLP